LAQQIDLGLFARQASYTLRANPRSREGAATLLSPGDPPHRVAEAPLDGIGIGSDVIERRAGSYS
jgi:hypothetical protein